MMSRPDDIDHEAMRLLEEADWPWSDHHKAFVEARDPQRETTEEYRGRQPAYIAYAELQDHGLAGQALPAARRAGIQWLREKLSAFRSK